MSGKIAEQIADISNQHYEMLDAANSEPHGLAEAVAVVEQTSLGGRTYQLALLQLRPFEYL